MLRRTALAAACLLACVSSVIRPAAAADAATAVAHGLAMHGDLKYGPGFKSFDYVKPDAPVGGEVRLSAIGSFDSLNPFILKGVPAGTAARIYDTLTVQSSDEPFSEYGLLAETIEVPEDRSWVQYALRKEARWHDGQPVTPEDVVFTFDLLKSKGHPQYRAYYANVAKAEKTGERTVRFTFAGETNRELPLIMGQLAILPKHYWATRDFEKTTLEPPLGSGPYKIETVDAGRSITVRRVADYWGRDLPVRAGQNRFEVIRVDYYRDPTVALEAFKAGEYDFRQENTAKTWATGYDFPAVTKGLVKKLEIPNEIPTGMQGYVYNLRRPLFQDRRVRQALAYGFDFEWSNKNLFYDAYTRTRSYFSNSELASKGLPQGEELAVLEKFKDKLPPEVFTAEYAPPATDGSGNLRDGLRTARQLLEQAGWTVKDKRLVDKAGKPFEFEILLNNPQFERITLPFVRNLERLGITAHVRTVDTAQYQNREDNFDFDMTVGVFGQSLSPGNEQRDFWSTASADTPGSRNTAGIKDPVVDQLVDLVIAAPNRESLVARTHALDRVLLWGHYVIPHWHVRSYRMAFWDKFGRPETSPRYSLGFETWWVEPEKAARLERERSAGSR